jgi:hypothetical protein
LVRGKEFSCGFLWVGCCCDRASGRALLLGCVEFFSLPVARMR